MNKKLILIAVSAIVAVSAVACVCFVYRNNSDILVSTNVEALARNESGIWGNCEDSYNDCIGECPNCGADIYAGGYKGPAYGLHGTCNNCHHSF